MYDFLKSIPHNFSMPQRRLLEKAVEFGVRAHGEQKRKSGEDFILHPISAAIILGQIFPDPTALVATVLHDIPEDTGVALDEIKLEFGAEVAALVDGVTKLGKVRLLNSKDEYYVENLRKMFLATSQDLRVIMIKLADRLHNMQTLEYLSPEKQLKIASETLEMYAPIAGRLGIGAWKDDLEDLAFKIVKPDEFAATKKVLDEEISSRTLSVRKMEKLITSHLRREGVKYQAVYGRTKRFYSLYNKLQKYEGDVSKVYDILAFRIITRSTAECYAALGILHKHFQPVPGRVKDFIATPKPNGYRSLHTTVFDAEGKVFEIQIRTDLMHEEAERGIAAHWFYSEKHKADTAVMRGEAKWLKELHAWQEETQNADEYLESLKVDFFKDRIFALTPKGDVKDLPVGATIIDFAFAVHTDLGFSMTGAKINGKIASIYSELKQGDVVEIIRSKKPVTVSRDWLTAAKTSGAKGKIRHHLNEKDKGIVSRILELRPKDFKLSFFSRKDLPGDKDKK